MNEKCTCQNTRFISLDEHISNGETQWTSVEFKCVDCGEFFCITYTPEDVAAVTKKFGEATFANMRIYLSSKERETVKELSERLGISERSAYDQTQSERDSERQAIEAAVDFLYNSEGLTQEETAKRVEKSQSTVSEILKSIREAREKA